MAYLTVVCGSTELTLLRVCPLRHKVRSGGFVGVGVGVAVGVGVGVGDADGVADAVADGEVIVPPGVRGGVELVLCVGAGCTGVALGAAGGCRLRFGRGRRGLAWGRAGVG